MAHPETILQFGTGAFLRGFIADLVDQANQRGMSAGSIVAVGSTGSGRENVLNDQGGRFTLHERGRERGVDVRRRREIRSIGRALSATTEWDSVLALARSPDLRLIVSNTTEVGITPDASDTFGPGPPTSFPGKLTRVLYERAASFAFDPARGVIVLPCELIERNGARLRALVVDLGSRWGLDPRFATWLDAGTCFCDTLVDRIVSGAVSAEEALVDDDRLMTVCEPYLLFAIQGDGALRDRLPFARGDHRIVVAPDITPFRMRKVRVLNGAHTVMAPVALLCGMDTVADAIRNDRLGQFVRRAVCEEIVPSLDVEGGEDYAREVLDRLANPDLRHGLAGITLHGTAKMRIRVLPSIRSFMEYERRVPDSLAFGFAALLFFLREDQEAARRASGVTPMEDSGADRVRSAWRVGGGPSPAGEAAVAGVVQAICSDEALWQQDLSRLEGFAERVAAHLVRMFGEGVPAALDAHLAAGVGPRSPRDARGW